VTTTRFTFVALVALITTASAEPMPYPKPRDGQCASTYTEERRLLRPQDGGTRSDPEASRCAVPDRLVERSVVVRAHGRTLIADFHGSVRRGLLWPPARYFGAHGRHSGRKRLTGARSVGACSRADCARIFARTYLKIADCCRSDNNVE
jgi:hypothetical protein